MHFSRFQYYQNNCREKGCIFIWAINTTVYQHNVLWIMMGESFCFLHFDSSLNSVLKCYQLYFFGGDGLDKCSFWQLKRGFHLRIC